jgi:WD40 repeat protein
VLPWVLLIWLYLRTSQAANFELISIAFATIAGMIGAFHGLNITFFGKELPGSSTLKSETGLLDENKKESPVSIAQPLNDASKPILFRLSQFCIGFIAGFLFVSVFWYFISILVFGFAWNGVDTLVGSAIVGGLGGIAGGLWRGFFFLPVEGRMEGKTQFKSFFQACSQFKQSFLEWLKPNPLLKLSQWITHEKDIKADSKEPAHTANRRPAIFDLLDGKSGFRLWLWTSYIFLVIATGIFFVLQFLSFPGNQAAKASIGISRLEGLYLTQVAALMIIVIGLAALVVGPLSGWFAGGISKFTRWSILYSPAKNLGVFGLFLTLIAFMLQLVEPLAALSHTTFPDTAFKNFSTPVDALAWSPDGNYIASGSVDGKVRIWSVIPTANTTTNTYVPVAKFNIVNTGLNLTFLAWSPDNAYLVLGTSNTNADRGALEIWNVLTGTNSFYRQYHYGIFAVAWSLDGTRLAWGDVKGNIYISTWNAADTTQTWDVATKKIYSCSNSATQQEWDPITSRFVNSTQQAWNPVMDIAWSPNSSRIVSACPFSDTLQIHDANTGKMIVPYQQSDTAMYYIAWSPDGKSIAAVGEDNTVRVWNANNGQSIITYNPPSKLGDAFRGILSAIDSISWSPDSSKIASSSEDGTVQVWDAFTGDTITTYRGHINNNVPFAVLRVAWSPIGNRIASSGVDETVQVWEVI